MDQSNNHQNQQNDSNRSKQPFKQEPYKQPAQKPYQPKHSNQGWYPDKGNKQPNQQKPKYEPPYKGGQMGMNKGGSNNKPWGYNPNVKGGNMPPYQGSPPQQNQQWQGQGQGQGQNQQMPPQNMYGQQMNPNMPPQSNMGQNQGMPPWMQNGSGNGPSNMNGPNGPNGPSPGFNGIPREQSYIENILRLNTGKEATFYMTFENNETWNDRMFTGIIQEAGKDHIVVQDTQSGKWYLLLMIYLDYVEFNEEINYQYPFG